MANIKNSTPEAIFLQCSRKGHSVCRAEQLVSLQLTDYNTMHGLHACSSDALWVSLC